MKRGASLDKVDALDRWCESDAFDETEQAALAFAEAMTFSELGVDEAVMEGVRQHFDDDAIVELTGLVAFQNMSSKFNAVLAVPPQGFCRTDRIDDIADRDSNLG